MDDLISRQAAIDEFYSRADDDGYVCYSAEDMEGIIRTFPSAQPELPEWVQEVERMYNKALCKPYIQKPLAWALYEVWKKHDREDAERRTDDCQ